MNVAIISPAILYGLSPSIEHPVPLILPEALTTISKVPGGFVVSAGKNLQNYIHVLDMARLYLLLVSYAIDAKESEAGLDLWGPKAYYFGAKEELASADFMAALVSVLNKKGIVQNETLTTINVADATKSVAMIFGTNMRVRSTRGKKIGWQPRGPPVKDTLDEVVERYLVEKKG